MIKRLAVLVAVVACVTAPAAAQTSVGGSYDWSIPVGDLDQFTENDSWLGFTLDIRARGGSNNVTFGGLFGYYEFYNGGITLPSVFPQGAISGEQYHHVFSLPVMLNAHYYAGSGGYRRARPFIGLNAGMTYLKQTVDIGIYSFTSDAWVFSAMPEIGIMLPTSGRTQTNLHVRYHIPLGSDNLYAGGSSGASMQYVSIGLGFNGRMF